MQKRRPIQGSISSDVYEITTKENVRVEDFVNAIKRLADEHLRGSVSLEVSGRVYGITDISVSITAKIIKMMLRSPYSGILKISINNDLDLRITLTPEELPPTRELAKIITFARSAGYKVDRDERSVTLTSSVTVTQLLHVYAVSCDDIYEEMKDILLS